VLDDQPAAWTLPDAVAVPLCEAARRADYERLKDLLASLPAEHRAAAEALERLVAVYAYDRIEALLAAPSRGVGSEAGVAEPMR
jgi:hypothetical protein